MISGPRDDEYPPHRRAERGVPGEFVSAELRDDCARFLDQLLTLIHDRLDQSAEPADWVPHADRPARGSRKRRRN